jgi:predicted MFS family arabinose efflux permease
MNGWAGDVGQHDAVSPVVFSWVFAAHQLGAAIAAAGAGWLRDLQGNYDMAFYLGAALCFVAAVLSAMVRRNQVSVTSARSAPASRS